VDAVEPRGWSFGRHRHVGGVEIRRNVDRLGLRLLLLRGMRLLRLLRGGLGLLLGLGQLILHHLQLALHGVDLLLQLGVVCESGRGNQEGRPEYRSSQQDPQSSFDVHFNPLHLYRAH
jgi:hypothetical protein